MRNRDGGGRVTDRILAILLIFSVAGIGLRALQRRNQADKRVGVPTEVYAVWRAVDRRCAACLTEGEILRTEAGAEFGTVLSLRTAETARTLTGETGTLTGTIPSDPLCDVYLTVLVFLHDADGVLKRENGQPLPVGASYVLYGTVTRPVLSVLRVGSGDF